jgi:hypothetical protein
MVGLRAAGVTAAGAAAGLEPLLVTAGAAADCEEAAEEGDLEPPFAADDGLASVAFAPVPTQRLSVKSNNTKLTHCKRGRTRRALPFFLLLDSGARLEMGAFVAEDMAAGRWM